METRLKGKAAIVTGANRGIGKAIAARLASEGAPVVLCARDGNLLEHTVKEIESAAYSAKKERDIIDPQIIEALGNAQCGTINGLLITAKTVRRNYAAKEAHTTSSRPVKIKDSAR